MHKTIRIRNLHCAACAAELQEELAAADGLSEVSVDFVTQRIALEYEGEEALKGAIHTISHFEKVEIVDGSAPVRREMHLKELISIAVSALLFIPALANFLTTEGDIITILITAVTLVFPYLYLHGAWKNFKG